MNDTNTFLSGEIDRLQNLLENKNKSNVEWKFKYSELQRETSLVLETRNRKEEVERASFNKELESWREKYNRLEELSSLNVQELTTKSERERLEIMVILKYLYQSYK